jgi:esterase
MYLNEFATGVDALDMTQFDEFASLLRSAADLGIPHSPDTRYVSRNVVINHLRFHFLEWGDPSAPPVLVLHGGNQSGHSWDLVSLHLADRFHVYALDQRGHGDSEWTRESDYSSEAMASDAVAFLAQEGVHQPIVMGHSMGGIVTMTLTIREPEIPRAVVIVDSGPQFEAEGTKTIRNFITANVEFDSIDEFVDRVQAYDPFRSREHMERTARYNLVQRADGKYVSKSDRVLHQEGTRRPPASGERFRLDEVKKMTAPTLVVRGAQSNILAPESAEKFASDLPNGSLVTVPDCGHNVHTQNTPGFLEAIGPFLAEI